MEAVLSWGILCVEASIPYGCSVRGIPPAWAGVPMLSHVIMELLPSTPVILVIELRINLTRSLNPDVYKYVRNTNGSTLRDSRLSPLSVPGQRMCFVPVPDTPEEVLEGR